MVFSAASRLLGLAWALEASASCPVHGSQLLQLKVSDMLGRRVFGWNEFLVCGVRILLKHGLIG